MTSTTTTKTTTLTVSAETVLELRKAMRVAGIEPGTGKAAGGLELGPFTLMPLERETVALEVATVLTTEDRGLVEIQANGRVLSQLLPTKAHDLALQILKAAEAAISDQVLVVWLGNDLGVDRERRTRMLSDVRTLRHGTRSAVYP